MHTKHLVRVYPFSSFTVMEIAQGSVSPAPILAGVSFASVQDEPVFMSWQEVIGHDEGCEFAKNSVQPALTIFCGFAESNGSLCST